MAHRLGVRERRPLHVMQIRAIDDGGQQGRFAARVMQYDIVDDYRTEFAPHVFNESMAKRLPRITWGHDWADVIGRTVAYEEPDDKFLDLIGELDDFDAVPRARQAYAQLQSGTIQEFSVGFLPQAWERNEDTDVIRFTKARLDEVALVLAGAVPGTELLAIRRPHIYVRSNVLTQAQATDILVQLSQGDLDLADALMLIKTEAVPIEDIDDEGSGDDEKPSEGTEEPEGDEHSSDPDEGQGTGTETPPEPTEDQSSGELDADLAAEAADALALVASI